MTPTELFDGFVSDLARREKINKSAAIDRALAHPATRACWKLARQQEQAGDPGLGPVEAQRLLALYRQRVDSLIVSGVPAMRAHDRARGEIDPGVWEQIKRVKAA